LPLIGRVFIGAGSNGVARPEETAFRASPGRRTRPLRLYVGAAAGRVPAGRVRAHPGVQDPEFAAAAVRDLIRATRPATPQGVSPSDVTAEAAMSFEYLTDPGRGPQWQGALPGRPDAFFLQRGEG
jgi:hypothetical protein